MHFDLIITGMGLSGLIAAMTAVEMGKKVLIVGKGMGTICLFSNTIDLLGVIPLTVNVEEGLFDWIKTHPEHPYAKAGYERIKEAFLFFTSMFPPFYFLENKKGINLFIPTSLGTLRPTYIIPSTMLPWDKEEEKMVVGFKGFKDFYVDLISYNLNCRGITLSIPGLNFNEVSHIQLARFLEKKSFRRMIAKEIKRYLKGEKLVGFPAVLGINNPFEVKRDLENEMGVKIFEIPTLPPSIPGLRVFNHLKKWLIDKGVTFLHGFEVTKTILEGKRCKGIEVLNPPVKNLYEADKFILATGRFIGGGLKAQLNSIVESIFNLPINNVKASDEWFGKSFFDKHSIHMSGISVNSHFQPVYNNGGLLLENVWVCGTIISGHQCFEEKSKEGIEIVTGYLAAKEALKK